MMSLMMMAIMAMIVMMKMGKDLGAVAAFRLVAQVKALPRTRYYEPLSGG